MVQNPRSNLFPRMNKELKKALTAAWIELPAYAVLVGLYLWLAVRCLSSWLAQLFHEHKAIYAVVAVGLIVAQGLLLELMERGLLALGRGRDGK